MDSISADETEYLTRFQGRVAEAAMCLKTFGRPPEQTLSCCADTD